MKGYAFIIVMLLFAASVNAQAKKYLNFGGIGTGLYGGVEFPVAEAITVGPAAFTDWNFTGLVLAAKGNFYFDELFELTEPWDVYLGANVGWLVGTDYGFNWGAQIGGRWFWNDRWGLNAEFGGGSGVNGGLGVTMKL